MKKRILIFSTMFSVMLSFSVMAKPIYTENPNGGYDYFDPSTGCNGHVPSAPITVGGDSSQGNTEKSNGSTKTEKSEKEFSNNNSVTVTGSTTDNNSKTVTDTTNTSGSSNTTTDKSSGNNNNTNGEKKNQNGTKEGVNTGSGKGTGTGSSDNGLSKDGTNTGSGSGNPGSGTDNTGIKKEDTNTGSGKRGDGGNNTSDYVDANGKIIKEKFTGAIKKVELGKDGKLVIYSYDEDGNVVTETSNNSSGFTRYTFYTDEEGKTHSFNQKVSQSDDYIIEETFLYYTWEMINLTNSQSKFYGYQVQVAKTTSNSAKVQPDLDGTYKIIGTPWYRKDYYKEITVEEEGDCDEFGNCDTDTHTERVLVDSKIVAKSSVEYTAKVPLFCTGCPVPVICVNGACDCASELNAVCDEANAPKLTIKERVELEK